MKQRMLFNGRRLPVRPASRLRRDSGGPMSGWLLPLQLLLALALVGCTEERVVEIAEVTTEVGLDIQLTSPALGNAGPAPALSVAAIAPTRIQPSPGGRVIVPPTTEATLSTGIGNFPVPITAEGAISQGVNLPPKDNTFTIDPAGGGSLSNIDQGSSPRRAPALQQQEVIIIRNVEGFDLRIRLLSISFEVFTDGTTNLPSRIQLELPVSGASSLNKGGVVEGLPQGTIVTVSLVESGVTIKKSATAGADGRAQIFDLLGGILVTEPEIFIDFQTPSGG